jgi:hypothetical protein
VVGVADPAGSHLDPDLTRRKGLQLEVRDRERLTGALEQDCLHRSSLVVGIDMPIMG